MQLDENSNTDLYGRNVALSIFSVTVSTNIGSGAVSVASLVLSMPNIFELSSGQVLLFDDIVNNYNFSKR